MIATKQNADTTAEQKAFFDAFGFLVLRQVFDAGEIECILRAFGLIITQGLTISDIERDHLAKRFTIDPGFCDRHPDLRKIVDDERISLTVKRLLGSAAFYKGSDGHLYTGDTAWHPDMGWSPEMPGGRSDPDLKTGHYYPGVKIAMYVDRVTRDTGCLRVIPGSHISPYHEMLGPVYDAGNTESDPPSHCFGLAATNVPCCPLESEPGDAVIFSHQTWHSAFGGKNGRRMFSMNFLGEPKNDSEQNWTEGMKARAHRIAEESRQVSGNFWGL